MSSVYGRDCLVRDTSSEKIPRGNSRLSVVLFLVMTRLKKKKNLMVLTQLGVAIGSEYCQERGGGLEDWEESVK